MTVRETNDEALALAALGWILAEPKRADRLLALTGLTPEALRSSVAESAVLAAILRFLEGHEPDLVSCAEALELPPERLVEARSRLEA
jgi:hypothetical protein